MRIRSLQSKPELNGVEGIVSAEVKEKGRWRVEVVLGKALSLKPSCLTVVVAAPLIWPNAPPICRQTIELVADATRGWHRTTHWLHHLAVRDAVFAVLVVAERLQREDALLASLPLLQQQEEEHQPTISLEDADPPLPLLPPEIWFHMLRFFLRSWWAVNEV